MQSDVQLVEGSQGDQEASSVSQRASGKPTALAASAVGPWNTKTYTPRLANDFMAARQAWMETVVLEFSTSSIDRLQPLWEAGLDVEAAIEVSSRSFLLAGWASQSRMVSSDTFKASVILPTILINELNARARMSGQSLSQLVDFALNEWLSRVH